MHFLAKLFVLATVARPNFCDGSANFTNESDLIDLMEKFPYSWHQFQAFRQKFDKKYVSTSEERGRFQVFRENLKEIERLNAREEGTAVYGVTEMADWSREEFLAKRATVKPTDIAENSKLMKKVNFSLSDYDLPAAFDWRSTHTVTPVKDQGYCGSCWAFASVANIEHMYAIKTDTFLDLSEQQLVDCSKLTNGCHGGAINAAFQSVIDMGGLVLESKYPYKEEKSRCTFAPDYVAVKVEKYVALDYLDEKELASYIATKGSTVNCLHADMLQFYTGGVIKAKHGDCEGEYHAVLVVGYGRDSKHGLDFWTVKNSWGRNWGEAGYFRIARGSNTCGIASFISSVEVADDDDADDTF